MKKIILISVILITLYYIWKNDSFQKTFYPRVYWEKQITAREKVARHALLSLENAQISFDRKLVTSNFDMQQFINEYLMGGMSYDTAIQFAAKDNEKDLSAIQAALYFSQRYVEVSQKSLAEAQEEFSKHK